RDADARSGECANPAAYRYSQLEAMVRRQDAGQLGGRRGGEANHLCGIDGKCGLAAPYLRGKMSREDQSDNILSDLFKVAGELNPKQAWQPDTIKTLSTEALNRALDALGAAMKSGLTRKQWSEAERLGKALVDELKTRQNPPKNLWS